MMENRMNIDERFEEETAARRLYWKIPKDVEYDRNLQYFFLLNYYPQITVKTLQNVLNLFMPKTMSCVVYELPMCPRLTVRYYYKEGNCFVREVPIILKTNRLFIFKPWAMIDYSLEKHEQYMKIANERSKNASKNKKVVVN